MNNVKLTFPEMKEIIELFVKNKLNALKIGDLELQKNHYEVLPTSDNKASFQEDPLFYSAAPMPIELQEMLAASMNIKKK